MTRSAHVWKETIMATVRIRYWRDIPSEVEVEDEGCLVTRTLSNRYQSLIHQLAAMQTPAGTEIPIEQWRETAFARPGDAITVAFEVIDELEGEFDRMHARRP
jgi:hypothetical protein